MADDYTQLNIGLTGDFMDESKVIYETAPTTRKRQRIVIAGLNTGDLAEVYEVVPADGINGLVVRPLNRAVEHPGEAITFLQMVTLVPQNTETTSCSYLVPTGFNFYLVGFCASGDVDAQYLLYNDISVILSGRTTAAYLNVQMDLGIVRPTITEGSTVNVTVTHFFDGLPSFDATVLGYLVQDAS